VPGPNKHGRAGGGLQGTLCPCSATARGKGRLALPGPRPTARRRRCATRPTGAMAQPAEARWATSSSVPGLGAASAHRPAPVLAQRPLRAVLLARGVAAGRWERQQPQPVCADAGISAFRSATLSRALPRESGGVGPRSALVVQGHTRSLMAGPQARPAVGFRAGPQLGGNGQACGPGAGGSGLGGHAGGLVGVVAAGMVGVRFGAETRECCIECSLHMVLCVAESLCCSCSDVG